MNPNKKNFLVEIGTEELPSKNLRNIALTFTTNVIQQLDSVNLKYDEIHWFASPRRLAIKVEGLNDFILNNPTTITKPISGSDITLTKNILPKIVNNALFQLLKKDFASMRWGEGKIMFIRPVHSILLLLGDELISIKLLGIQSSRKIFGHRFMGELNFNINCADEYPEILLSRGKVIACYEERKRKIAFEVERAASQIGGKVKINNLLLEELTSLVEWPVVLIGSFDEQFLSIPILTHIIQYHHKSFIVYNSDYQLIPKFIFIANIESQDSKRIIEDNEKVLHSRLYDAKFFINEDRKKHLEEYCPFLEKIIFQHQLGTLFDKVQRIKKLAVYIAETINVNNINDIQRAALLAKCDLSTNMVFEFPNSQGIIGMHYALLDGEKKDIAISIKEHYHPAYKKDILPSNIIGCIIAIADKIDNLTGIMGIGICSTGDKDPFGLRRNALGILRIIIEKKLSLNLQNLIEKSIKFYKNKLTNFSVAKDVMEFLLKRLLSWYNEKGYRKDIIKAVSARDPYLLCDLDARIKALSSFKESYKISLINKRISNFLRKNSKVLLKLNQEIDVSLLIQTEEKKLNDCMMDLTKKLQHYFNEQNYEVILKELIKLYDPINNFFKFVPININDNNLKINRLKLLIKLEKMWFRIADFSLLQSSFNQLSN
ncbi:MAG: glycine--tRNA ligase subunit beta [Candidatus Dasytiphilus stammeri]